MILTALQSSETGINLWTNMRRLIHFYILLSLVSCASLNNGNIAPGYFQAYEAIKTVFFGYENELDPEVISNIPYASMVVKIGNGPSALMILESINGNESTWISADGVYLVLNEGKIVKTKGLPNDLYSQISSFKNWKDAINLGNDYFSYFSFLKPELNNLEITSSFSLKGKSNIQLTFERKELFYVSERLSSEEIGWNVENSYWIDSEDFVWKSIQHISPRLPPIYIEITKKPR